MNKHTTGPWSACLNERGNIRIRENQTSHVVAKIETGADANRQITNGNADADARLVAAAPTMLQALADCEEYFDQRADAEYFTDSPAPVVNEEMTLLTTVRHAIAKAKGEYR